MLRVNVFMQSDTVTVFFGSRHRRDSKGLPKVGKSDTNF